MVEREELIELGFMLFTDETYKLKNENSIIYVDFHNKEVLICKDEYSDETFLFKLDIDKIKQLLTLLD